MPQIGIVEALDVIEPTGVGDISCSVRLSMYRSFFDVAKKIFMPELSQTSPE